MGLRWEIDRRKSLVTITAEGQISRAEVEALLDDILRDEVLPLAKLVDCSMGIPAMPLEDLLAIGMRIKESPTRSAGALAILRPQNTEPMARLLGILATLPRPMKIFRALPAAMRWLEARA